MTIGIYSFSDMFSRGLQCLLKSNLHFQKIEPFQESRQLFSKLEKGDNLDLLIIDMDDFQGDILAEIRDILSKKPDFKILLIGSHEKEPTIGLYRLDGAMGFVDKSANFEKLHLAIDMCLDGKPYFPPRKTSIGRFFSNSFFKNLREEHHLSDREMEIMELIFCQCETNEIANKLSLSPHTVRTHRKRIYKKLKIHNLSGLLHLMP